MVSVNTTLLIACILQLVDWLHESRSVIAASMEDLAWRGARSSAVVVSHYDSRYTMHRVANAILAASLSVRGHDLSYHLLRCVDE